MDNINRWERIKNKLKNIKKKGVVRAITFILIIVIICLTTFSKLILDPSRLVWNVWISDTVLILGIGIVGMVLGEGSGLDNQKTLTKGRYQTELRKFYNLKEKIEGRTFYFSQWLMLKKQRDLEEKQMDYLSSFGLAYPEYYIRHLTIYDINELKTRAIKKNINNKEFIFKTITDEQFNALQYVFTGNITVENDNTNYFFETNIISHKLSSIEMGKEFRKQDTKINIILKLSKIGITIATSMIWATLTVSEATGGASSNEVYVNLFSRLFSLFFGFFGGITSAVARVNNLSDEIENKTNVLTQFIYDLEHPSESGFFPKNYEDLAKEEFVKQEEEEKEAIESVVDAIPINSNNLMIEGGKLNE